MAASCTMRLYDSTIPSGNAYKVRLLLAQLDLEYAITELDILATPSETREPAFLAKNPNGRIPVLELDDGRCLPESNAILCYLAQGTPLLASEPVRLHAKCRGARAVRCAYAAALARARTRAAQTRSHQARPARQSALVLTTVSAAVSGRPGSGHERCAAFHTSRMSRK